MITWRHLPHIQEPEQAIFLTWRLYDSLPPNRPFPQPAMPSGKSFAIIDRLLDEARTGPFYLRQPAIANIVVAAIYYNAEVLHHYVLHAFAVIPNHVHMLMTPLVPLPS